jgi:ribosome-binding protein aMBF1 (putative translation factor)
MGVYVARLVTYDARMRHSDLGPKRPHASPPARTRGPGRKPARYGVHVSNTRSGFGRYLARQMTARGFTTTGELARELGVNRSDVSRWINGQTQPSVPWLRKLAPVLRVPVLELLIEAGHITRREVMDSVEQMSDERSPR